MDKDGVTVREVLEGLLARTGRPEKRTELESRIACPPLPAALSYLWTIYRRMRRRKGGGFGLSPIEWPDIDACLRHLRITLSPWEIETIEDLDDLFLTANAPKPQASGQPNPKD